MACKFGPGNFWYQYYICPLLLLTIKTFEKKLFTAVPQCHIKFRLLLCNWCTIYMVSYDHYGFLAFFNINLTGKRTPAAATKLQCFGTTRWYQWYHGTKYVGTTRYHYI